MSRLLRDQQFVQPAPLVGPHRVRTVSSGDEPLKNLSGTVCKSILVIV